MLSVVILNFNRPNFIKHNIVPQLNKYHTVDNIIISNGKKETALDIDETTCLEHHNIHNEEYGLSLRFLSALSAKNEYILIIDDDIIPSEETIEFLYSKIQEDKNRIYGIYGRNIKKYTGYEYTNVFGEVPVILTRCLICTKEMCQYYIDNFRKYESEKVKQSTPYWNGEDILFSLLSIKKYDKLPIAFDMKHYNRLANYVNIDEAVSFGRDHQEYRKEITNDFIGELGVWNKIVRDVEIEKEKTQLSYFFENSNLFLLLVPPVLMLFIMLYYFVKAVYKKKGIK
tara:strand:+ start:147 stop:1001 length:855 start_codon:yes stop_codon:yes gene_type:complete